MFVEGSNIGVSGREEDEALEEAELIEDGRVSADGRASYFPNWCMTTALGNGGLNGPAFSLTGRCPNPSGGPRCLVSQNEQ